MPKKSDEQTKQLHDLFEFYVKQSDVTTPEADTFISEATRSNFNEEPAPNATFVRDLSQSKWQFALPTYERDLEHLFLSVVKGKSDPDEPDYIALPLSDFWRDMIAGQYKADLVNYLLKNSRASREYFRLWYRSNLLEREFSELTPPSIKKSIAHGTSLAIGFLIFHIAAATDVSQSTDGLWVPLLVFGPFIVWIQLASENSKRRKISEHKIRIAEASESLDKASRKMTNFIEKNSWLPDKVSDLLESALEQSDRKIEDLEAHLSRERLANLVIDGNPRSDSPEPNTSLREGSPPPKMSSLDPEEYENYCAWWLEALGSTNVYVTQFVADGGIDIVSDNEVAQVKLHSSFVGVAPIRELYGASIAEKKNAIFFTSRGYTAAAVDFAETNDILLFVADPIKGTITGETAASIARIRTAL